VISFHLDWQHSPQDLLHALNHYLPDDVRAMQALIADDDFHPRYSARLRRYRYQMYFNDVENPLSERYAWRIWPKPDIEVMKECAELFLGKHDFRNFGKPPNERSSSIRTIQAIELELSEDDSQADVRISADAFLYHMVRRIVYVLVRAGKGCIGKNEIKECIDRKLELPAGIAPAKGLFLEEIIFS
jgi:tRNA pseudouridine38-40 synthase